MFRAGITDGISKKRLEAICNAEKYGRCVIFPTKESAKVAAEEAFAEAFCDLAESSANEALEDQSHER